MFFCFLQDKICAPEKLDASERFCVSERNRARNLFRPVKNVILNGLTGTFQIENN